MSGDSDSLQRHEEVSGTESEEPPFSCGLSAGSFPRNGTSPLRKA